MLCSGWEVSFSFGGFKSFRCGKQSKALSKQGIARGGVCVKYGFGWVKYAVRWVKYGFGWVKYAHPCVMYVLSPVFRLCELLLDRARSRSRTLHITHRARSYITHNPSGDGRTLHIIEGGEARTLHIIQKGAGPYITHFGPLADH